MTLLGLIHIYFQFSQFDKLCQSYRTLCVYVHYQEAVHVH